MTSASLVLNSTYLSLAVQFITGVIGAAGLFVPTGPEHKILKSVLLQETIVQVIEFFVYVLIVLKFNLDSMATTRYYDWFFTTPLMLFTTIIYYKYTEWREKNKDTSQLTITKFISEHKSLILTILLCNLGMLVSGYLGEIGAIDKYVACTVGFAFFVGSFGTIYYNFAQNSKIGKVMFSFMLFLWTMYGVAFLMPAVWKNIGFNALDIFAKNFFGVFLFIVILKNKST